MVDDWRTAAACRGIDPRVFYPTTDDAPFDDAAVEELGMDAKRVCAGCPVSRACLRFAVEANDRHGVWAGLNDQRRQVLRRLWIMRDMAGYSAAVDRALAWVAAIAGGQPPDQVLQPARVCRCGDLIPEGRYPEDRNGPGATCGLAATYNKGCRCGSCVAGKAAYRARGKVTAPPTHPSDEEQNER